MQSAEELAREISDMADIVRGAGGIRIPYIETLDLVPMIEADRNATRLAAKLEGANEVLDELARVAGEMRWNDDREMLTGIYKMLRTKYAPPEPQPPQEGR